jgi:hypothetical protein
VISVPISPGELIDKITILALKTERIADAAKLANVRHELEVLRSVLRGQVEDTAELREMESRLKAVNGDIWDLEDTIRDCERKSDFGDTFVTTARNIYKTNDARAALKKEINLRLGSAIVEEKSYATY